MKKILFVILGFILVAVVVNVVIILSVFGNIMAPTPTITATMTLARTSTPAIPPEPSQTPTITPIPTSLPLPTLTPLGMDEIGKGHLHGKIVDGCAKKTVPSSYYAVLFRDDAIGSTTIGRLDENGEFWIKNLEPGKYFAHTTDNLSVAFITEGDEVLIYQDQTTDIILEADYVCADIILISPKNNEVVKTTRPVFGWESPLIGGGYFVSLEGPIADSSGIINSVNGNVVYDNIYSFDMYDLMNSIYKWQVCFIDPSKNGMPICSFSETFSVQVPE